MSLLKIKPLDTLFFRDGKPFNLGEDTLATGMFPPLPSTVYGALRTSYIFKKENGPEELLKGKKYEIVAKVNEALKDFKLNTLFLEKNGCCYFPLPMDMGLVDYRKNEAVMLKRLNLLEKTYASSPQKTVIGTLDSDIKKPDGSYFFAKTFLEDYFYGIRNQHYPVQELSYFLESEPKVGIGREGRTCKEGHLYRVNMNRLYEDVSLQVLTEGISKEELTSMIRLGGEGKTALLDSSDHLDFEKSFELEGIIPLIAERKRFKVLFLTPALVENSLSPIAEIEPIAAAVGKPVMVGGWDMAKGWHKEMHKAIPAGSVYYYEYNEDLKSKLNNIHLKNHGEMKEEGFGFAMVTVESEGAEDVR